MFELKVIKSLLLDTEIGEGFIMSILVLILVGSVQMNEGTTMMNSVLMPVAFFAIIGAVVTLIGLMVAFWLIIQGKEFD
jgi:hypothetical protein